MKTAYTCNNTYTQYTVTNSYYYLHCGILSSYRRCPMLLDDLSVAMGRRPNVVGVK